jgi:hypothetical protein
MALKKGKPPKVGDKIPIWCSGSPDGLATIIEVRPYTGTGKKWFRYVVRFSAMNTSQGWMETVW